MGLDNGCIARSWFLYILLAEIVWHECLEEITNAVNDVHGVDAIAHASPEAKL